MESVEETKEVSEHIVTEQEEKECDKNNLSKTELKRLENEKRIKRIHELMELIDKTNEEMENYQDELWDLLKTQIKLPNKQKRERKPRIERNEEEEEVTGDEGKKKEKKEKEKEVKDISKKISPFDRFFKPQVIEKPQVDQEISETITLTKVDSIKKQRARAVSYDDLDKNIKKKKIDHFEVTDIYQIEGIEPEFVRECLEKCDITGDIRLFRRLFIKNIPKEQQIVRFLGGKNYQVKRNDLWIEDNGNYIKSVLSKIFEKSYIIVNELDHYNGNIDQFLINQDHITQFDDDKYMEKLLSQISTIIDIKNKGT